MRKTLLIVCALLMSLGSFAKTPLTFDQYGNVELSQFDSFADNDIVTIEVIVTNAGGVAPGWGIGKITDIAYAKDNTDFAVALSANAVSEEGALNKYEFTVAQLKAIASIAPENLEALKAASGKTFGTDWTVGEDNYIVDPYQRSGIVVNVWAGTRSAIYVTEAGSQPAQNNIVFTFEDNELGDTYASIRWGNPAENAVVVENPLVAGEKALRFSSTNWDGQIIFPVTLPAGKTLDDYTGISFDTYVEGSGDTYKEIEVHIGDQEFKNGSYPKVATAGAWTTTTRTFEAMGFTGLDAISGSFDLRLGLNDSALTYYLDNVTLIAKALGIVLPVINPVQVRNVRGGIVVSGTGPVAIYGIDGRLVKQTVANNNQTISLENGLYIVKAGIGKAVKVLVK